MSKEQASHNKRCSKQWLQVNNAPWLSNKSLKLVKPLLKSYQSAFGECLLTSPTHLSSSQQKAKLLFTLHKPVLVHDNSKDPYLIYANYAALQLWDRCWEQMIGMPSRLTTPKEEQIKREDALLKVSEQNAIKHYEGIRVNSKGEYFMIRNACIWTIWDEKNILYGQAATFDDWSQI